MKIASCDRTDAGQPLPDTVEVRERLRAGLADLIASRDLSVDDFWRATWVGFADGGDMYRQFQSVHTEFFGDERPGGAAH